MTNETDKPMPASQDERAETPAPDHHENSTDATRGAPLVQRAQARRAELAALLDKLPEHAVRERTDIGTAITTVDDLLTGDLEHVSNMTSQGLSKWLESNKHLAEVPS